MAMRTYTVQEAAERLEVGSRRLFRWLREQRIIDAGNIPFQQYRDKGLMSVRYGNWVHPVIGYRPYAKPVITQRGLKWLRERLKEVAA